MVLKRDLLFIRSRDLGSTQKEGRFMIARSGWIWMLFGVLRKCTELWNEGIWRSYIIQ
ncbi:BnaC02g29960D [Brassica napus]|uniref:BnaC02g29960D protein n=1 Tax=Brassica napus TaxID=3708 RepID=A0A078FJ37_BRANA|nr:BnaC02g29960D [Brassica napus]